MRSSRSTSLILLLILLSAAGGILLLVLGRPQPSAPVPLPSPSSPAPLSPTPEPSPTVVPSPATVPLRHVVRPGETLSDIAADYGVPLAELIAANNIQNPDLIHPGDVLVIPGRAVPASPAPPGISGPETPAAPPPSRPPLPTLTPSGPPGVEIVVVLGAGDRAREMVRLRNRGGVVSLEGWTLSGTAGNRFVFPRLLLFPGAEVVLHSGPGESTPLDLYWNRTEPAWRSGELLILRDERGETVDTYVVP